MMLTDNLKVKSFIQAAPFESRLINTLFLRIANEPVKMLYRINPLLFAQKYGLDERQVVNIFILAACAGIFDIFFDLVCPACGLILMHDKSLSSLNKAPHFCAICHGYVPIVLDDTVEIVFHIHPSINETDLNPFENPESFSCFFFSPSFQKHGGIAGQVMNDISFLSPGETKSFKLNAGQEMLYRLIAINLNLNFLIYIGSKAGHNEPVQVTVNEMGFSQKKIHLNRGDVKVDVKNDCRQKIGISLIKSDFKENPVLLKEDEPQNISFFSGKMLLNNTTFRNLFKIKDLPGNLKLELRSLVILFIELKGSKDLHEKGDPFVYDLIQQHFYILEEIADRHHGAIIKTMGDVIMISFPHPKEGFLAVLSMHSGIKSVQYEDKAALSLKIGLHEGQALLINRDDRLDYFGRTVAVAAYLEGLAGPGEIFFSDTIFRDREIKKEFVKQKEKIRLYKRYIKLRGVDKKIAIYKMIIVHDD